MRSLVVILVCGLIAGAVATLLAPKFLSWYATPPVPIGVSCDMAISWSMEKLILFQALGLGAGAVIGAMIGFKMRKRPPNPEPAKS